MQSQYFDPRGRQQEMDARKRALDKHYAAILASGEKRMAEIVRNAGDELFLKDNPYFFDAVMRLNKVPVTIDEFLESPEFLGGQDGEPLVDVWKNLKDDVRAMNPDVLVGAPPIRQILLGGATGTGKTECTRINKLYQTYLLTCFDQPQRIWGLPPSTTIMVLFISTRSAVTKRVLYMPFRHIFTAMPYVQRWVPYDRKKDSSLVLDGNIEIAPSLPGVETMVGQAILMALVDEINFYLVIEQSKRTVAGGRGQGGFYDQAEVVFRTITRRRTGRFGRPDRLNIGCISAISSVHYRDDFLDKRISEVKANQDAGREMDVLWRRHKQYEVQPDDTHGKGETFRLLVGADTHSTRILEDDEVEGHDYPTNAQVEDVPMRYHADFLGDPEGSLRDVIGVASAAIETFITQRHKIIQAIQRWKDKGHALWVFKENVDLLDDGMPQVDEEGLPPKETRRKDWFVHIDLSKNKDRCGIAFVCISGFQDVIDPDTHAVERLPHFRVGMAITIQPHVVKPLDIAEVRQWVMLFHTHYGFNIRMISYDGFNSEESIILIRKAGINSRRISVDATRDAYDDFKDLLYTDRVDLPPNEVLRFELANVELNQKTNKVDHPPKGSKDVADAVVGAINSAITDRRTRGEMDVSTEYYGPPEPRQGVRRNIKRRNAKRR